MQTHFSATLLATAQGQEADAILRRCVHCGFCTATCPTYQLLGDELDGPRGRIYLIKELLEAEQPGAAAIDTTRLHLDRCLTCRSCETTCPSGVEYGRLLEIGRERVEHGARRPWRERVLRWGLRQVIPYPGRFRLLSGLGRLVRPLLPRALRNAVPPQTATAAPWPAPRHARRVILLQGCVQSVVAGEINTAAAVVLDRLGISAIAEPGEGCCGALDQHLSAPAAAAAYMRANIERWWPLLEDRASGVEAIVSTASACGLQVKDYGYLLRDDAHYAHKAQRVSALVRDIAELLAQESGRHAPAPAAGPAVRVAFHAPCTLQHGQRLGGVVEPLLRHWGFETVAVDNAHLCCGSAGTYSITQPALSAQLRDNKLAALQARDPQVIASANIGCLLHLRAGTLLGNTGPGKTVAGKGVPVKHWIELLAARV